MTHTISAEMVANVGSVQVSVGDAVGPTDVLVLLESMKMEIPVVAPRAGTLLELRVAEGEAVAEGDVVAVLRF